MATYLEDLTDDDRDFVEQLLRDRERVLSDYSVRNIEMQRMEKWYFKQHYDVDAEVPSDGMMDESTEDDEHLTVVPIPTNVIDSVHGMLTDEDIYIQCLASSGRRSEERASNTERFLHGTYWINRQTQGGDPWEDAALDQLIYGWGCVYTYWDTERAELARDGKGRPTEAMDFYSYPLVVKRISPRDIYPLANGVRERWRGVLWIVNRTIREVEEEWGETIEPHVLMDDDGSKYTETLTEETLVEYIDYWVWRRDKAGWMLWHCVMAHNQVIKMPTEMPEYGALPYEIFFCRKTPSEAGSKLGLSFLYPLIEPVQEIEYLVNRLSRMIEQYSDPMIAITGAQQGPEGDIEKGPGTTIYLDQGGDVKYVTWQGNTPDFQQLIRFWRETAQDAYPPVLTGMQGGTSGLDTVALQSGGKLRTNKPRRNLELAIQRVNAKIIHLLQKFSWDEPIFVMGQRTEGDEETPFAFPIKGRDTRGFENTIVTVRARFPQEELRNVVLANQAIANDMMSARDAASKYMFVQDPEKAYRKRIIEKTLADPSWRLIFQQMYLALPPVSPVTEALQPGPEGQGLLDRMMTGENMAESMIGEQAAAASATTASGVQRGVQQTPVTSNIVSGFLGGAAR